MSECITQEDAMNMSNEQAIQILTPFCDMLLDQNGCPISDTYFALEKAIEALKFRDAYKMAAKAANEAFRKRQTVFMHWIPCSERLPEEKQVVLITNGKEHVRCGQYQGLAFRDSDPTKWWWKNKTIETVIAWMPLPKPYQEE